MVRVRPVRMGVATLDVLMLVRVRSLGNLCARVSVLVVLVVDVPVRMDDRLVDVRMLMPLAGEEPRGDQHEGQRRVRRHGRRFAEDRERQSRREEWRRAEQGAGASGSQSP